MANEDKKDFNAMLHDSKDMPKFQTITDQKSIEKYGGSRMYFAPPIDYDKVMKLIPYGKVITVGKIREYFAELNGADFTEPITNPVLANLKGKRGIERKISRWCRSTEGKAGSRRPHNYSERPYKHKVFRKGLRKCSF